MILFIEHGLHKERGRRGTVRKLGDFSLLIDVDLLNFKTNFEDYKFA